MVDGLRPGETPILENVSFPSSYELTQLESGKIRDRFLDVNNNLVLVTRDHISAFDNVLGEIPHKGQVLNRMSKFWFENTADIIQNHMIATPDPNVMICRKAEEMLPVEVVIRDYMTGVSSTSIWTIYNDPNKGDPYELDLRPGYQYGDKFDETIITPTTKAVKGEHDMPISEKQITELKLVDPDVWQLTRTAALALFERGKQIAQEHGFYMVNTKIEFGLDENGNLMVIDELFTPDNAAFRPIGGTIDNPDDVYDKEYLRLAYATMGYRGKGEIPLMPADLREETSRRYIEIFERITGERIEYTGGNLQDRVVKNVGAYYGR